MLLLISSMSLPACRTSQPATNGLTDATISAVRLAGGASDEWKPANAAALLQALTTLQARGRYLIPARPSLPSSVAPNPE